MRLEFLRSDDPPKKRSTGTSRPGRKWLKAGKVEEITLKSWGGEGSVGDRWRVGFLLRMGRLELLKGHCRAGAPAASVPGVVLHFGHAKVSLDQLDGYETDVLGGRMASIR